MKLKPGEVFTPPKPSRITGDEQQTVQNVLKAIQPSDLPLYCSPKRDGARYVLHKLDGKIKLFSDDEKDETDSPALAHLRAFLEDWGPSSFIIDAELELWDREGRHWPREATAGAIHQEEEVRGAVKGSGIVANVFAIYWWGSRDLSDLTYREMWEFMQDLDWPQVPKEEPPSLDKPPLALIHHELCEDLDELGTWIRRMSDWPGAEGVVVKQAEGKTPFPWEPGRVRSWMKYHKSIVACVEVIEEIETKGPAHVYRYGILPGDMAPDPDTMVGKVSEVGKTFGTSIEVKPGEKLLIEAEQVNHYVRRLDGEEVHSVSFWVPRVLERSDRAKADLMRMVVNKAREAGILVERVDGEIQLTRKDFDPDKPLLQAFGSPSGKKVLAKHIVRYIPDHKVYVEPFAGGAAVFFRKPKSWSEKEVLGDLDSEIAFAYRFIQNMTKSQLERLKRKNWRYSYRRFNQLRDMAMPKDPVDRFWRFYYVLRASFMHKRTNYGWGKNWPGKSMWPGLEKRLWDLKERLRGVVIRNQDWEKTVREFDSPETFFYLDPPYIGTKGCGEHFGEFSSEEKWLEFLEKLKRIKGKFVLSAGPESSIYRKAKELRFHVRRVHRVAFEGYRRGEREPELLIANFPLRVQRKLKAASPKHCMRCSKPPEVVVIWADGRGRAWFCRSCYEEWLAEEERDVVSEHWLKEGENPREWAARKKEKDPYMELLPKEDWTPYVVHHHWRGKGCHADFRVALTDFLVGWTWADMVPGAVKEPVTTLSQARKLDKDPSVWKIDWTTGEFKERRIRGGVIRKTSIFATTKAPEPKEWLEFEGVVEPGQVGATDQYPGVFLITDSGECFLGCLPPDEGVLTSEGIRPISEVEVGDYLLGDDARWVRVLHKFSREESELIHLEIRGLGEIRLSPNHPVWAVKRKKPHLMAKAHPVEPEWVPARDLRRLDWVAVPKIKRNEALEIYLRNPITRIERILEIDEDLAWLLGLFMGDGYAGPGTPQVQIQFSIAEPDTKVRVERILEDYFGIKANKGCETSWGWQLTFDCREFQDYLRRTFYRNGKKRVPPEFLFLKPKLLKEFLKGYYRADGRKSESSRGQLDLTTASYEDQRILQLMMNKLGVVTGGTSKRSYAYRISWLKSRLNLLDEEIDGVPLERRLYLEDEDYFYLPVRRVRKEPYAGVVMNLETEDNTIYLPLRTHNSQKPWSHEYILSGGKLRSGKYLIRAVGVGEDSLGLHELIRAASSDDFELALAARKDLAERLGAEPIPPQPKSLLDMLCLARWKGALCEERHWLAGQLLLRGLPNLASKIYGAPLLDESEPYLLSEEKENGRIVAKVLPPAEEIEGPSGYTWLVTQAVDQTPYVLSKGAVEKEWLPPPGYSALPPEIQDQIPGEFRFWTKGLSRKERLERRRRIVEELMDGLDFSVVARRKGVDDPEVVFTEFLRDLERLGYLSPDEREKVQRHLGWARPEFIRRFREELLAVQSEEMEVTDPLRIAAKILRELPKAESERFYLVRRWFRGPIQVRWGPSEEFFDLHLGDRLFILQFDPREAQEVLATEDSIQHYVAEDGREIAPSELGDSPIAIKPGTDANPTKATPGFVRLLDAGKLTVLDRSDEHLKAQLQGRLLKGTYFLRREEVDSPFWSFSRSEGPGGKRSLKDHLKQASAVARAISKALRSRDASAVAVWKDSSGKRRYVAICSAEVRDLEGELVSSEAMDFSIALARRHGFRPLLTVAHQPWAKVGRCSWEARLGRFWLEGGEFDEGWLADKVYEALLRDRKGRLRVSIGFFYTPSDRDEEGRYRRLFKWESSITENPALPITAIRVLSEED